MSQQINLFNPIFLKKKKQFSAIAMLQGLGLILIGMVILAVYSKWEIRKDSAEALRASNRLKTLQGDLVASVEKGKMPPLDKALEAELQKLDAQLQTNRQMLGYAGASASGRTQRYTDYFRAFSRQAMPGVWLTGFSLAEGAGDIEITGRALRAELVPAYIRALHNEAALRGRAFASIELEHRQAAEAGAGRPAATAPVASADANNRMESLLRGMTGAQGAAPARPAAPPAPPGKAIRSWFDFKLSSDEPETRSGSADNPNQGAVK